MPVLPARAAGAALRALAAFGALATAAPAVRAQRAPAGPAAPPATERDSSERRPWYERLSLRGYTQARYNRLLETNADLECDQCDRALGRNNGFSVRRSRLVISGDVHPRVSVYLQPDFVSEANGQQFFLQLRDVYFDVFLDAAKTTRLRVGQSKLPYGFANMQSSSNRLTLDRDDALNSAAPNERDLGAMLYWENPTARRRFDELVDGGLKGSGDYGVLGLGVYNGQGTNRPERNDRQHVVARAAYPFVVGGRQVVGAGRCRRTRGATRSRLAAHRRVGAHARVRRPPPPAATLVVYPPSRSACRPRWKRRPRARVRRRRRPGSGERGLSGGYALVTYRARPRGQELIPYARVQRYDGGQEVRDRRARPPRARARRRRGVGAVPGPSS
jgi:hypothetical protein